MNLEVLIRDMMKFRIILNKLLVEYNLTLNKWTIINLIHNNSNITAKEIEYELFMDKATVSQMLSSLVSQGYITKEKNPTDKRFVKLAVSESGLEALDFAMELDNDIAQEFGLVNLSKLNRLLGELDAVFENFNPHKTRSDSQRFNSRAFHKIK